MNLTPQEVVPGSLETHDPLKTGESSSAAADQALDQRAGLLDRFQQVRSVTEALTEPLTAEDMQLQSMEDASPTKWHLAHTSWFFETFLLRPYLSGYRVFDPDYHHLFNSYYNSLGQPFSRPQRGLLSRPGIDQVFSYRAQIDSAIDRLICEEDLSPELEALLALGLNHEQQHQELLLTDIKHAFSINPLLPAYLEDGDPQPGTALANQSGTSWRYVPEDTYTLGYDDDGFQFDNEGPAHQQYLQAFRIAPRLVTNGEYLEFMEEGGYHEPRLWLSDGWHWRQQQHALRDEPAPLYWQRRDGHWYHFTLAGLQPVDPHAPVSHINFYEADAFASWAGKRLPTEFEWEVAAWQHRTPDALAHANLLDQRRYQPIAETRCNFFGNLWQWTSSAYQPYPGYRASADAVGEYNGKFMCNQKVLRGGSCVTPTGHIRISYRNFFYPHQAWQFTGIRLAEDAE